MLIVVLLLLLAGLALLWLAGRQRREAGLPAGRVIYADTRGWGPVEVPLFDPVLGLTGRPDYLVRSGEAVIPVEVKSRRAPEAPYDSHIFQVAAYCLLVEKTYEVRPPYGLLHYANRTFAIDYTPELENALLDLLGEMRRDERRKELARSHDQPSRCRGCGYRGICDQALTGSE